MHVALLLIPLQCMAQLTILLVRRAFGAPQTQPHTARAFGARTARLRRAKVAGKLPHSLEQTQMFSGAKLVTRTGASRNPPAHNADSKAVS